MMDILCHPNLNSLRYLILSSRVNVEKPLAKYASSKPRFSYTLAYKHYQRVGNNNSHSCGHYGHTYL